MSALIGLTEGWRAVEERGVKTFALEHEPTCCANCAASFGVHTLEDVQACAAAFERVGLPEGLYPLAQAALYLASTEKSNSLLGFFDALKTVKASNHQEVPSHLRDANRDGQAFGDGVGYRYPHAYAEHWVAQQYQGVGIAA